MIEREGVSGPTETVLVTGYPSFTARRLTEKIINSDDKAQIHLLVKDKIAPSSHDWIKSWPDSNRRRVSIVLGNVTDMDLGLAGAEYKALTQSVTRIHHLSGIHSGAATKKIAEQTNVGGTRGVIDFAGNCKQLRRLCHWSSVTVSGKRQGVVLEEELDEGQRFANAYEQTFFEAEKRVRAAQRKMPITIFRPSTIVGDSRTGEIDHFDGPYYLMMLIAEAPGHVRIPLPGRGIAPIHLVPINYVVDAAYALSLDEKAAGSTFHLVDPSPMSAHQVFDLVAEVAQKKSPRGYIPTRLTKAALHTPGLQRIARERLAFLETFDKFTMYNARHTLSVLRGTGIECPSFDSYVEQLIRYLKKRSSTRKLKREEETADPFD